MSRCFPYPPTGYVGSKASNDALIESIKLQREKEKVKAERKKEKKREKKEKRERKEKDKATKHYLDGAQDQKSQKSAPNEEVHKSWADSKGTFKEKTRAEIDEQMEKSGLTEEHQQPVSVHKPSYSSDSTESSNKRKRPVSPSPSGGISGHGNAIRIRLPLRKHKKPKLDEEAICSTSGRTELAPPLQTNSHIQRQTEEVKKPICSTLRVDKVFAPVNVPKPPPVLTAFEKEMQAQTVEDKKPICSTSRVDQVFGPVNVPKSPPALAAFEKEMQAANLIYKNLLEKLPPANPSELIDFDDDQEWLFGGKKQQDDRKGEKRHVSSSDLLCCGSSLLQPCAQFLPDVGIYALPYTLPF